MTALRRAQPNVHFGCTFRTSLIMIMKKRFISLIMIMIGSRTFGCGRSAARWGPRRQAPRSRAIRPDRRAADRLRSEIRKRLTDPPADEGFVSDLATMVCEGQLPELELWRTGPQDQSLQADLARSLLLRTCIKNYCGMHGIDAPLPRAHPAGLTKKARGMGGENTIAES